MVMPAAEGDLGRPRTLEEAKTWMRERLARRIHPMGLTEPAATQAVIDGLTGLDGANWASAWMAAGKTFLATADDLACKGERIAARDNYFQAYAFFFLGRFPCPNHPAKEESYRLELEAYARYGALLDTPVQPVSIDFAAPGYDPGKIRFYLRAPNGAQKPPVVVMWGGVDAWKEEMTELSDSFIARGVATVALDNVGTGESPIKARRDGEVQFLPVLDWVRRHPDLDGRRIAVLGRSFGGHWATKLAHIIKDDLRCAVNWGGGVHFMFQPEWIEKSRYPDSYLMELVETRSRMLGATNEREYVEGFRVLSLLNQGLLSKPCAPLLLVNGKEDKQCPIADIDLLLEHGDPKSVRLFPGGHMGFGPHTVPTIVEWVAGKLR
jgi:esterase FrsA